jgi:hypothetical protein
MMRKLIISLFITITVGKIVQAQPQLYTTAIGLNAGFNYGITLKHYLNAKNMIEGIANFNYGPGLTVLYEFNNRHPFDVDEFDWFYGFGAHAKFVNGRKANVFYPDLSRNVTLGIDGIIGLEYTFKESPINIGLNVKPELNFTTPSIFWFDGALTLRYVLK